MLRWKRKVLTPAVIRVVLATDLILENKPVPSELGPKASNEWCNFCPVNGLCEAYAKHNIKELKAEFSDIGELELPSFNMLTIEEADAIIAKESNIVKWLKDLKEYRKQALKAGEKSEKFKLVESLGNREFKYPRRVVRKLKKLIPEDYLYSEKKLESPAHIEKVICLETELTLAEAKRFVDPLCKRDVRGVSMVLITDKRRDLQHSAADDFAELKPTKRIKHDRHN